MRKIIVFTTLILMTVSASAWTRLGHAVVAKIAEDHLTPTAKAKVYEYLNGESMVRHASYADDFGVVNKDIKLDYGEFSGGKYNKVDQHSHVITVDEEGNLLDYWHEYGGNARFIIERYVENLKHPETLTPEEIWWEIVYLTHVMGDFHCPVHIFWSHLPRELNGGKCMIYYRGELKKYHYVWDRYMIEIPMPYSFSDIAWLIDTFTPEQIAEVTKGDLSDWAKDSALASKHVLDVKEGDKIEKGDLYYERRFLETQLCKAGYRLAKMFNEIFDPQN
jgi:hypothetical protein